MNDFIYNGQATGSVASMLLATDFNVNSLRPYVGKDGRSYITVLNAEGKLVAQPLSNATATLRKDDWKILDTAIVKAAKPRLRAVADLRGAGLDFVIPNGMGKTVLETETQSDISDAEITMDGLEETAGDRPQFGLENLPLPIIHKNFSYSARQIAASRSGGSPLDTTTAELAARSVAEEAEKLLIGTSSTFAFGGGTLYGYLNYPNSIAATITSPVAGGWLAATTVSDVLGMVQDSIDSYHYGPWRLYYGPSWSQYMNDEYKAQSDDTIRQRLARIDNIQSVSMLDYLTGYNLVLVQMTSDVVREVVGMEMTTVQWSSMGGLKENFKVMAIMCPQLRKDYNDKTGIVVGSV